MVCFLGPWSTIPIPMPHPRMLMFDPRQSIPSPPVDLVRLSNLAINRNGFVFDPKSGHSFTVNPTGLTTLELLQEGASTEEIARRLSKIHGVAMEIALGAVEGFVRQLARNLA